jgi:hypothetical protein
MPTEHASLVDLASQGEPIAIEILLELGRPGCRGL